MPRLDGMSAYSYGDSAFFGLMEPHLATDTALPDQERRRPNPEEQKVIYDVMHGYFDDALPRKSEDEQGFMDGTAVFMMAFEEAGLAAAPVEVLTRTALHDTVAAYKLSPEDFGAEAA